jgi:GT2 family glycosyltransferase
VTVVVPHYRDLVRLDSCLSALERQTYPRDRFDIVVADNNSPEGEAAVSAAIAGRAALVVVTEKGAGPNRNGGVSRATGEVLAFTDCDCLPEPQWLASGVEALSRYDIVGGDVRVFPADLDQMTPVETFDRVLGFTNAEYIRDKGFTVTANLFCLRTIFDAVGGFRNDMSEDVEWSHRARDHGYRLGYAAQAIVQHPARRTWEELLHKWRRLNRESFGLVPDTARGRLWWLLRSLLFPASAVAHTPLMMTTPLLRGWRQRRDAVVTLFRLRLWRMKAAWLILAEDRALAAAVSKPSKGSQV